MRNALIISSIAFIVVELGILYSTFVMDVNWPVQAIEYWEWQIEQPLDDSISILPYLSLVLIAILILSAVALVFGFYAARWTFAGSVVAILIMDAIYAFSIPPQLFGADYLLNEFALLLAGIVGALAFCVQREGTS